MELPRIGVDVGGTFTDLVAIVGGEVVTAKVPSTPNAQADAVVTALEAAGLEPGTEGVAELRHGTTVATNALLERRGARTALVTTHGFRDVLEIGRQNRPALYDLTRDRPPPLVPRELRFTVRERMGPTGELAPLDEASLAEAVERLRKADVEAVAVCLLFGYLHPAHERRVGEAIRDQLPDVHVALASEILPEFREYERCATTAASAYLGPRVGSYLARLADVLATRGLSEPRVLLSSGGVASVEEAAARAAGLVLSGPAGGAVGARRVAALAGLEDALTLDMGGTSADVALIRGGTIATTTETLVAGVPVRLDAVDVHSVSAGGGSIAWVDAGGALRVGPRSAGADPGPAAYGRGGDSATVTDASLVLGHLADGAVLGGEVTLDRGLAERAVGRLAHALGLGATEAAAGVLRVANAEMARALRVVSVERGIDPRGLALVAFGGAGPMHACALADDLGVRTILVPAASGVLSALGLAFADVRRDRVAPFLRAIDEVDRAELEPRFRTLEAEAAHGLEGATLERRADMRYRGQAFELTVEAGEPIELGRRFHAAHDQRYGYRMDEETVEVVALRVTARVVGEPSALPRTLAGGDGAEARSRRAAIGGPAREVPVVADAAVARGSRIVGPAIVELADATCVIHPGWTAGTGEAGTLVLERK